MDNFDLLLFLQNKIDESHEARDEFIKLDDEEMQEYCSGMIDAYEIIKDLVKDNEEEA